MGYGEVSHYYNPTTAKAEMVQGNYGAPVFGTMQKRKRYIFPNASLDTTNDWDIIQQGSGHVISVSGGMLGINTGVTINSETIIQSKDYYSIPFKTMFAFYLSQKIANQEFYFEIISIDGTTYSADALFGAAWKIAFADNATNTYASYDVYQGGTARANSGAQYTGLAQTASSIFEIEASGDECLFYSKGLDSASSKVASYVRHQQIPDPNKLYKVRIRAKNLASAPASATDLKVLFVNVNDYTELNTELTGSCGNSATVSSIPVNGTVTAALTSNAAYYAETTTNLGVSATYTGSSHDAGSTQSYTRLRVIVNHVAGNTPAHLVIQQSTDGTTWRETHRVPVPSDANYRHMEFPWTLRYARVLLINGATAETAIFLSATGIRVDGGFDFDKTLSFLESTTALGISATYTGNIYNLGGNFSFNRVRCMVVADQTGTLYIDQSRDGATWRTVVTQAVAINTPLVVESLIAAQYVRARYVNGGVAQTVFELETALIRQ